MSALGAPPPGTFVPGTKVTCGSRRVVIEKWLSEGGFAHVYVVRVPTADNKHSIAVLKRVAVPDKDALANMRTEVETMKKLQGHKHIVKYIDSHASQLKGGGYEVFLLMEFCNGGGLIDFMNTRLQVRLTEPEILKIFGDVSEGVATMHYLKPPLLHRDLKVENVLIAKSASSSAVTYKLCDFGSTAPPRPAATTATEGRLIEEDIQRHTTMQYRSPEMVDVWRKQPIDEKSDIWALGVLLYKLCYYTTPFEEVGQMAILNARFKYPPYPAFSDRLKRLIGSMLMEDPKRRPNIYQVVKETCSMRGTPVPIKDIYAARTQSEARSNQQLPDPNAHIASPPPAGISHVAPVQKQQVIPEIAPMRRGRPTGPAQAPRPAASTAKPGTSPARGDPFSALDSTSFEVRADAVDELSARFPSVEQFSIAVDQGSGFNFQQPQSAQRPGRDRNGSTTNALADEVFAQTTSTKPSPVKPKPQSALPSRTTSVRKPDFTKEATKPQTLLYEPKPVRPGYASTGTMTSPAPSPTLPKLPDVSKRPIWRVPERKRDSSQPRASPTAQSAANSLQPSAPPAQRPALLDVHRSKSQTATMTAPRSPTSSRPSLEGHRPSQLEMEESITRARSANSSRPRPVSAAYVESNLDFLRDQERESASKAKRPSLELRRSSRSINTAEVAVEDSNIENDTDYLRSLESNDGSRLKSSRQSSAHRKRASLPALSISGTKNMFAGRFGDAFKRFEQGGGESKANRERSTERPTRTPSPQVAASNETYLLSPISGSEATASPSRHVEHHVEDLQETQDLPPEMRREMERRLASAEEQRVAEAAAEYRGRTAGGAPSRASTIQRRVQSLLEEGRQSPVKRTAEGYGRYTGEPSPLEAEGQQRLPASEPARKMPPPTVARKPLAPAPAAVTAASVNVDLTYHKVRQTPAQVAVTGPAATRPTSSSAPVAQLRTGPRAAPPKPKGLKPGAPGYTQRPSTSSQGQTQVQTQPSDRLDYASTQTGQGSKLAALLARDNEGVAAAGAGADARSLPAASSSSSSRAPATTEYALPPRGHDEDWEADFSKRFPSLSGIEMVETEIGGGGGGGNDGMGGARRGMRIKEV